MRPLSLQTYQDFFHSQSSTNVQDLINKLRIKANFSLDFFGVGTANYLLQEIALLELVTGTLVSGTEFKTDEEFFNFQRRFGTQMPHSDKIKEYNMRGGKLPFVNNHNESMQKNGLFLGVDERLVVAVLEKINLGKLTQQVEAWVLAQQAAAQNTPVMHQ